MSGKVFDRQLWQMDLAQFLVAQGIQEDWNGTASSDKPKWMRKMNVLPCSCKTCYFCVRGLTHGVAHKEKLSAAQKAAAAAAAAAAATASTHKWEKASSGNKCGICLDKKSKAGVVGTIRRLGVASSTITCFGCMPTGRTVCKRCRTKIDRTITHTSN